MARLASREQTGRWQVSLRGYLGVADLRRLEQKCAPALAFGAAPLELDVGALRGIDEAARRFVVCLLYRGTVLVGENAEAWRQRILRGDAGPAAG